MTRKLIFVVLILLGMVATTGIQEAIADNPLLEEGYVSSAKKGNNQQSNAMHCPQWLKRGYESLRKRWKKV